MESAACFEARQGRFVASGPLPVYLKSLILHTATGFWFGTCLTTPARCTIVTTDRISK